MAITAAGIVAALWRTAWRPLLFVLAGSELEQVARETDPARVVRDLCRTLDLDYRPAMLDVAGQPLWPEGEGGDSRPAEPSTAISAVSVGRHLRHLAPGEARYVEWRARREMADWGYARAAPAAPGGRARIARCLAEEGAWRLLRSLRLWAPIARALGRLPRERG